MFSRRQFLPVAAASAVSTALVAGRAAAAIPEAATAKDAATQPPLAPHTGPDYNPVVTTAGRCRGA